MTNVLVHVPSRPADIQILETEDAAEGDADAFFSKPLNKNIKKLPENAIWSKELKKYIIPEANMVWINQRKCYMIRCVMMNLSISAISLSSVSCPIW